jgi:hypothetical protein
MINFFIEKFISVEIDSNHSPFFWSCYSRWLNALPRPTKGVERYHRHLNDVFNTRNPTLFSFGKNLIIEQVFNSKKMMDSFNNNMTNKIVRDNMQLR